MQDQRQHANPLSSAKIQSYLRPRSLALLDSISVVQTIGSTNSELLAQPINLRSARACIAEAQETGRGRRGNDWQSAPNKNVMMSLSWGFEQWPDTITGLGLAVALSTVEALNSDYDLDIKIKWPNDLMVGDDKLGGILIDMASNPRGGCNVVIGLGLNVHQPDWSVANADYQWQDLNGLEVYPDRNVLIARFIDCWLEMLVQFSQTGFSLMRERWNKLSSYASKQIRVGSEDDYLTGTMLGVDAQGALLVEDAENKVHVITDSNVSVRLVR